MKCSLPLAVLAATFHIHVQAQDFVQSPYQDLGLSSTVVADFNGDNRPDVLGIQFGASPNKLVIQLNAGADSIAFNLKDLNLNFDAMGRPAAGNMDGDQDVDFVVASGDNLALQLLLNDGAANFTVTPLGVSGSNLLQIVDIDKDTDPDIVGINTIDNTLTIYRNDGSLNFTAQTILSGSDNLEVFAIGDLDNDNDPDIAVGYYQFTGKQIVLLTNKGDGSFNQTTLVNNNFSSIEGILIDDINGDNKNDILAIRSFGCTAFLNQGMLSFTQQSLVSASNIVRSFCTGDFNGDGRTDIVLGTNSAGLFWYKNLSNTTLEFEQGTVGGVSPAFSVVPGDFDNDDDEDLIVSNGEFWWYDNKIIQEQSSTLNFAERTITLYPNPFTDVIQLTDIGSDAYTVRISDLFGRTVFSEKNVSNSIKIGMLAPGTYVLSLINNKTRQALSRTIVKAR